MKKHKSCLSININKNPKGKLKDKKNGQLSSYKYEYILHNTLLQYPMNISILIHLRTYIFFYLKKKTAKGQAFNEY